jgi:predicted ATPase
VPGLLARALADYDSQRDGESQLRFSRDTEVTAAAYLALAEWQLGEPDRARLLIDRAITCAEKLGYAAARANALFWKTILESRRDDPLATQVAAGAVLNLTEEHHIKDYADMGRMYLQWARGRLYDPMASAERLGEGLAALIAREVKVNTPSLYGLLADLETMNGSPERALMRVDEGLAIAAATGERMTDSYLHRIRGEILLKCDPDNSGAAEAAYLSAIAIACEQGARSFGLQAALKLAKLHQSTGRPAEAHAVLAPALEGFAPTPEMPEIAEAQALLSQLP